MEKLIVGPLRVTRIPTLIIIDALDECKDEEPASAILSILSCYINKIPNVKFFITGRPETRIRSGFRLESLVPITEVLRLHEVKPEVVDGDIRLFFQTRLSTLAKNRSDCNLTEDWPPPSDIEILCKKAAGFFIYASTAVKFVASEINPPSERLALITSLPRDTAREGKSGVDQLYTKVLEQGFYDIHVDENQQYSRFRHVVGTVLLIFNPLSIMGLSELLGKDTSYICSTIRSLHSLLLVPTKMEDPVLPFHKSFPDFLMDPDRCKDQRFLVEPTVHHADILLSCLKLMKERLKKNICNLDDYAVLTEVKDLSGQRKVHIGDALGYACCYWTKHLLEVPGSSSCVGEVQKAIDQFFTTYLLYWIEVLALMENLGIGVYAINEIEQWCISVSGFETVCQDLCSQLSRLEFHASGQMIVNAFSWNILTQSVAYHSALPFSPSSWLHECYSAELSQEVKVVKGLPAGWGTCSCTVSLDDEAWGLSYWNNTIAVGSRSGDIIILDTITGSQTAVLSGYTDRVNSLTFSSDGKSLVSGSHDKTVKLWDVQTGGVVKTFHGHTGPVWSVSISADSTRIASGSDDKTIHLWNIQRGECYYVIKQQDDVDHVSFSPTDPQHLISISGKKVWQWDINGNQAGPIYNGSCAAFSSDGTQFVSCNEPAVTV